MKTIEGKLQAGLGEFAIVVSRFNSFITEHLLSGSVDALARHNVSSERITVVWVPGAFEIPLLAKKLAASGKFQAVIALGAVIRGSTPHFDYVAAEVSKGLASVMLETGVPTVFGVLTTDNLEQAIERAGTKAGNKGWDAAMTALEMVDLNQKLEESLSSKLRE